MTLLLAASKQPQVASNGLRQPLLTRKLGRTPTTFFYRLCNTELMLFVRGVVTTNTITVEHLYDNNIENIEQSPVCTKIHIYDTILLHRVQTIKMHTFNLVQNVNMKILKDIKSLTEFNQFLRVKQYIVRL